MLTGFDSKWVNTLYLDKMLEYANLIQAFSRTNRLFGKDKPFGIIRYYRRPHTMKRNIDAAVKLYSGDKPLALFVDKLQDNLEKINSIFTDIEQLFKSAGIENFEKLPEEKEACGQFAKLFKQFNEHLEAAKIQGFNWNTLTYHFDGKDVSESPIQVAIDEQTYLILALRYKELFADGGSGGGSGSVPFEIDGYLTEIDTDKIDSDYMNSRFTKYLKALHDGEKVISVEEALNELHKSFAALSHDEQRIANIFLHDVQRGDVKLQEAKSFRDYVAENQFQAKEDEIHAISTSFGLDESKLRQLISAHVNENNINEFARFDALLNTVDKTKAKQYFEQEEGKAILPFKVNVKVAAFLKEFVLNNSQSD